MLVAALPPQGLQAVLTVRGVVDGDVFAAYFGQFPGPILVPGDVVVPDNLLTHKVAGLAENLAAWGARLLYLPPCSSDLNSIASVFSKPEIWLHTVQVRTREVLEAATSAVIDWGSQ